MPRVRHRQGVVPSIRWLRLIVRKLEAYEKENKTAQWKLAGAMKLAEKIDVDAAIKENRQEINKALKQGAAQLVRDLETE